MLFALNVATLFAEVARADPRSGNPRARAAAFLVDQLGFSHQDVALLSASSPPPLQEAGAAARLCQEELTPPERMVLLDALFQMASASGGLSPKIRQVLEADAQVRGVVVGDQARDHVLVMVGVEVDAAAARGGEIIGSVQDGVVAGGAGGDQPASANLAVLLGATVRQAAPA